MEIVIEMVIIKSFNFNNVHSIILSKLETSSSQKGQYWNTKQVRQ